MISPVLYNDPLSNVNSGQKKGRLNVKCWRTLNLQMTHCTIFLSMYQTTQEMPPASQHFVRTKIFEVVSQTEASLLNVPQTPFEEPPFQRHHYYDLNVVSLNSYSSENGSSLTPCHESRNVSSTRSAEHRFRLADLNN